MNDFKIDDTTGDIFDDEYGELYFEESDQQNLQDIVMLNQGDLKEFPLVGCGFVRFENSVDQSDIMKRIIKLQAEADGYINLSITIDENNNVLVDGVRPN